MDHHDHLALGALGGGHWADRNPDSDRLYLCIMAAAIWTALIILISGLLIVTVSTNLLVPAVTRQRYDLIMVDAYQDITIPFQMSSTEFFTMVSNHLNPGPVMMVKMNLTDTITREAGPYRRFLWQEGSRGWFGGPLNGPIGS
ncbi:MAG: hypothetical protein ACRC44_00840 [Bifidobacterium asteroides]